MAKVIKSVSLVAGESFVLPPGAVMKGSSNNSFTSTCDIPVLETLTCYVATIGGNNEDGDASLFDGNVGGAGAHVDGYRLSGVDYPFTSSYGANALGAYNNPAIAAELQAAIPGIIATASGSIGDGSRGTVNYILIQTIPSISNNLQMIFSGNAPLDVDPATNSLVTSYVPFRTRSAVVALDYQNVPECPVIDPEA